MRRREFIAGLGVVLAVPLSAHAQQRQRLWRIGSLSAGSSSGQNESLNAFMKELNDLGYVAGTRTSSAGLPTAFLIVCRHSRASWLGPRSTSSWPSRHLQLKPPGKLRRRYPSS